MNLKKIIEEGLNPEKSDVENDIQEVLNAIKGKHYPHPSFEIDAFRRIVNRLIAEYPGAGYEAWQPGSEKYKDIERGYNEGFHSRASHSPYLS